MNISPVTTPLTLLIINLKKNVAIHFQFAYFMKAFFVTGQLDFSQATKLRKIYGPYWVCISILIIIEIYIINLKNFHFHGISLLFKS